MSMENTQKLPYIVAEIAQGFEGNGRLVELFCNAVKTTKADAIKFQIFQADELALKDYKYYNLFKSLELPGEIWARAVKSMHQAGKEFFSDVFGMDSLEFLMSIGVDGFKVHSTDVNNETLLSKVAATKKKVLLSTGGTEALVVDRAIDILKNCEITLMHGFQAEPTEIQDNHLLRIRTILNRYNLPVGFQDHTAGDSPLAHSLPFLAMGLGATLIEKHFTLSRVAQIEDYVSALTAEEFVKWADEIKAAGAALGREEWVLSEKEVKYKLNVRRAVCTAKALPAGYEIQVSDLALKRSGNEKAINELNQVVGKKLRAPLAKDMAIEREYFA